GGWPLGWPGILGRSAGPGQAPPTSRTPLGAFVELRLPGLRPGDSGRSCPSSTEGWTESRNCWGCHERALSMRPGLDCGTAAPHPSCPGRLMYFQLEYKYVKVYREL